MYGNIILLHLIIEPLSNDTVTSDDTVMIEQADNWLYCYLTGLFKKYNIISITTELSPEDDTGKLLYIYTS